MSQFARRFRHRAVVAAAAVALGGSLFAGLAPQASFASSHREAPLTSADPQIDGTDLYAFRSPDNPSTVTFVSNWIPFEEPAGGPNFYSWAPGVRYNVNIDNNGDAVPDVIYRWVFQNHYRSDQTFLYNTGPVNSLNDPNLNFYQTYKLIEIDNGVKHVQISNGISAPSNVGVGSMPDYEKLYEEAAKFSFENGHALSFAGQADDPFFLDLRIFDLLYGGNLSEVGNDTLHGFNVNALALQVPISDVTQSAEQPVIGVWTTAERRSERVQGSDGSVASSGKFVQVSRLGNPLVNEVVIPVGLKDKFNGSRPTNDGQFLQYVQDPETPHVVNAVYGLPIPDTDPGTPGIQRSDLISVFLTGLSAPVDTQIPQGVPSEVLRLNTSTPVCNPGTCGSYSRLGVIGGDNQGFPNGRRLGDDIVDIALRVVEGQLAGHPNTLGDGVDTDSRGSETSFPYVEEPVPGSDADPH